MHSCKKKKKKFVYLNLASMTRPTGRPKHVCSSDKGNIEGTNFDFVCLMYVHVCFALCLCVLVFCIHLT